MPGKNGKNVIDNIENRAYITLFSCNTPLC